MTINPQLLLQKTVNFIHEQAYRHSLPCHLQSSWKWNAYSHVLPYRWHGCGHLHQGSASCQNCQIEQITWTHYRLRGSIGGIRSLADHSKTSRKGTERRRMFCRHLLQTSLFEFILFHFILPFGYVMYKTMKNGFIRFSQTFHWSVCELNHFISLLYVTHSCTDICSQVAIIQVQSNIPLKCIHLFSVSIQ